MRELIRSNDPVLISFIVVLLRDSGIESSVADGYMSVMEGSLGVLPRRVMVSTDDVSRARRVVVEADLGQWLSAGDGS